MKTPFAAIISIVLFIVLEIIFISSTEPMIGYPYLQPTADDATVTVKRRLLDKSGERIVIVGDSSAMYGLQPSIIKTITKTPIINLGTLASFSTAGFTELAIAAMKKEQRPVAIVFSVLPQTLEIDTKMVNQYNLLGRYLLAYENNTKAYSPTFEEARSLWLKKHQFNIFPGQFGGSYDAFLQTLSTSDGWLEENHSYHYDGQSKGFGEIKVSDLTWKSFGALKKASELYSVPVIFIFNPKPSDQIINERYEISTSNILQIATDKFGFITPQRVAPIWDEQFFGTVTHLNKIGSDIYSRNIGKTISEIPET
jgi:hypothetical protein